MRMSMMYYLYSYFNELIRVLYSSGVLKKINTIFLNHENND